MIQFGQLEELPQDFAQQMMECEIRLEVSTQVDMTLVQKLMSLYVQGTGYYEGKGDPGFIYFQRKMNNLMTLPLVMEALNKQQAEEEEARNRQLMAQNQDVIEDQPQKDTDKVDDRISPEKTVQLVKMTQTRDHIKKTLLYHDNDKNKYIGHLLKVAEVEQKRTQRAIQKSIIQQNISIKERIRLRKLKALTSRSDTESGTTAATMKGSAHHSGTGFDENDEHGHHHHNVDYYAMMRAEGDALGCKDFSVSSNEFKDDISDDGLDEDDYEDQTVNPIDAQLDGIKVIETPGEQNGAHAKNRNSF